MRQIRQEILVKSGHLGEEALHNQLGSFVSLGIKHCFIPCRPCQDLDGRMHPC
jgi:hypothetical protein